MPDANVLVYAHRAETDRHQDAAEWVVHKAKGMEPFALSELVLSGFLRIVTNKKIFSPASTVAQALSFISQLRHRPTCQLVRPGARHWDLFVELCGYKGIAGKRVADAFDAALAIEHGCEWITADSDFALFQDKLRWRLL